MGFFRDSDIPNLMAEVGVAVRFGLTSGYGILDLNDEVEELDPRGGRSTVVMRAITLLVQTSLFPTLTMDSAITADGANYVVIKPLSKDDGALTKLLLRKA